MVIGGGNCVDQWGPTVWPWVLERNFELQTRSIRQ
ncbi:hypothetical protein LINPERPRIM_LOCUS32552 [Linum perenne]